MRRIVVFSLYVIIICLFILVVIPRYEYKYQQHKADAIASIDKIEKRIKVENIDEVLPLPEQKKPLKIELNMPTQKAKLNNEPAIKDYKAIGILEIPKIDIKLPILNITTKETLKISITAYTGNINGVGNFVIAGHNLRNGFEFGKLKYIRQEDIIMVNQTAYKVFDIFVVQETQVQKVIDQHTNGEKWVTLFTCTNGGKDRLVVRARAI